MKPFLPALCAASLFALAACGNDAEPPVITDPTGTPIPEDTATPEPVPMPEPEQTAGYCGAVSASGYCGVDVGMTVDEARDAFKGGTLEGEDGEAESSCFYLHSASTDQPVYFMFVDGIMNRVDIQTPGIMTEAGAEVGMMLDGLVRLYPGGEQRPNKYVPEQPDLVVEDGDGKYIFETDESAHVSVYRAGISPGVDYVEGCA